MEIAGVRAKSSAAWLGFISTHQGFSVASHLLCRVTVVSVVAVILPVALVMRCSPVATAHANPNTQVEISKAFLLSNRSYTREACRERSRRRRSSRAGHRGGCAHFVVNRFKLDSAGIRLLDSEKKSGMRVSCRTRSQRVQAGRRRLFRGQSALTKLARLFSFHANFRTPHA